MKTLFDDVSRACSKLTTKAYSTSFSLGILFLHRRLRGPVYAIYGFVRLADEIVDSFHDYDKEALLKEFRTCTYAALDQRISLNPILNAFQEAVHQYGIERELIDTFLHSMEMDLQEVSYDQAGYEEYILGSAEVVGLMCLHVFTEGNKELYAKLKPQAMKLGAAFQKINFLRDMNADVQQLGRVYFPNVNIARFSEEDKLQIEADIAADFDEALKGIRQLPASSQAGVYLAYVYYRSLFNKIRRVPPQRVMQERIRISDPQKIGLMFNSMIRYRMNML
jgi:phytoene synthase